MHACSESSNQGSPVPGFTKPVVGWTPTELIFWQILASINLSKTDKSGLQINRKLKGFKSLSNITETNGKFDHFNEYKILECWFFTTF